jgi:DNA-nicking Smr family endonuclease
MSRRASDEERRLFEEDFKQSRPLKITMSKAAPRKKGTSAGPSGVNGATQDRLRRGLLDPDARIDLHGLTQAVAHRTLYSWLKTAHKRGHRLVLVITGKGNPKNEEDAAWMKSEHGVLKQMVPRWLNETELAALIAHIRPAHAKHGGEGALYVYLRKS